MWDYILLNYLNIYINLKRSSFSRLSSVKFFFVNFRKVVRQITGRPVYGTIDLKLNHHASFETRHFLLSHHSFCGFRIQPSRVEITRDEPSARVIFCETRAWAPVSTTLYIYLKTKTVFAVFHRKENRPFCIYV